MFLFVALLIVLSVIGIKKKDPEEEVLSKDTTIAVNGIFVILIFLSHSTQYLNLDSSILNRSYLLLQSAHNQLVVTSFLTFSGYGVMEQIKTKKDYLQQFPRKRILKTLLNFDIAVICFLLTNFIVDGRLHTITEVFFALIGWKSVGNSNWYIFSILLLYIFTWISWILRHDKKIMPIIVIGFSLVYVLVMAITNQPRRFTSTILCYPFGMFISLYKETIFNKTKKHRCAYFFSCAVLLCVSLFFRKSSLVVMNIHSMIFMAILIMILQYVKPGNAILHFLGKYSFSIFILQRIPMKVLQEYNLEWFVFIPVCLIITIIISVAFEKVTRLVDNMIIRI